MNELEASAWQEKAYDDYLSAKHLARYPWGYPNACYHCQQAAEKQIKAALVLQGEDSADHAFKTHSLPNLLSRLGRYADITMTQDIVDSAWRLTEYEARSRYPGSMLGQADVQEAMDAYDAFVEAFEGLLPEDVPTFGREGPTSIGVGGP